MRRRWQTIAQENCNHHEVEEIADNKEQAKEYAEEITINAQCVVEINWEVRDQLMMDSGAGVWVCPLAYVDENPLLSVTEEE